MRSCMVPFGRSDVVACQTRASPWRLVTWIQRGSRSAGGAVGRRIAAGLLARILAARLAVVCGRRRRFDRRAVGGPSPVPRAIVLSAAARVGAGLWAPLLAALTLGAAVRTFAGSAATRAGPRPAPLGRILGAAVRIATGL
jgi:hypothetical protein